MGNWGKQNTDNLGLKSWNQENYLNFNSTLYVMHIPLKLLEILMFVLNLLTLQRLQLLTESYLENGEEPFTVDILKEMTSKFNPFLVIVIFFFVIQYCENISIFVLQASHFSYGFIIFFRHLSKAFCRCQTEGVACCLLYS